MFYPCLTAGPQLLLLPAPDREPSGGRRGKGRWVWGEDRSERDVDSQTTMIEKESRSAGDKLDELLDAVGNAIPPEHHAELRTLLRTPRRPRNRSAANPP